MSRRIVELSHPISDGMPTYPGLPRPRVDLHLDHRTSRARYDGEAEFAIGHLDIVGNIGTYLDSPRHRFPDAPDVAELPLDQLVDLPTVVVDHRGSAAKHRRLEHAGDLDRPLAGTAVLFRSGWDRRWGTTEYWEQGPCLGPAAVERLLDERPAIVGVDFCNVDDVTDPARPVHTALLGAGIPIVEHLRDLAALPAASRLFVVPLAVRSAPSLPVRVFALPHPGPPPRAATHRRT